MLSNAQTDSFPSPLSSPPHPHRAKVKEKAVEICLMLVEIDKQDVVQEELITGFANKQPKIVAGSVEILRTALALFGHKVRERERQRQTGKQTNSLRSSLGRSRY